jgi:hypothetical protein
VTNLPDKAHAELGASVAGRWMSCPGSVRMSRGIPNSENEHSRRGTAAHHVGEKCLKTGTDAATFIGLEFEGVEIDEDQADFVQVYVDYCRTLMAEPGAIYWVEKKFSLARLNPPGPMYGTSDLPVYVPNTRTLHVVDYKNGYELVEAVNNPQLKYYGLGAAMELEEELRALGHTIENVQLTIVQPRAFHPRGVVRHDHIPYTALLDFADELLAAAKLTLQPDAPLSAGPHCKYCPAAGICPAQRDMVQSLAQTAFELMPVDVPPAPETLPPAILADILGKLPILEEWARSVRAHGERMLETGEITPEILGQKLVEKRATRKWAAPSTVEGWLREKGYADEEIFAMKLKSPKQIETLMGKDKKSIPADFVVKESSGHTMVPLSDKREALSLAAVDVFEALPAGET